SVNDCLTFWAAPPPGGERPLLGAPRRGASGKGARVAPAHALSGTSAGVTGAPLGCTLAPFNGHREEEDVVTGRPSVQAPSLNDPEHPTRRQSFKGPDERSSPDPSSPGNIVDRGSRDAIRFGIAKEHEPDSGLVRRSGLHPLVDEFVENLKPKP